MAHNNPRRVRWLLVLGLGALALIRPLMSILGIMDMLGKPLTPVLATLVISLIWIAVVGLGRVARPVLTLTLTGLAYGILAILLNAVLTPLWSGQLLGAWANPYAVVSILATNAVWGVVAGLLALLVQIAVPTRKRHGPDLTEPGSGRA